MRNANWTRVLTILLSLLALYALLAVLAGVIQRFITPVLLLVLASIIAFVLTPVVDLLQRTLHVFRWLAILMTYILLICLLGSLGYFLTTPLIDQTKALTAAIKNPTSQDLRALRALDASAVAYLSQVTIYEVNTTQIPQASTGKIACLPNSGPCAPAPCYAAYFLDKTGYSGEPGNPGPGSPIWMGSGCGSDPGPGIQNAVWNTWRYGHALLDPFRTVRPVVGKPVRTLQYELARLSQSSIRVSQPESDGFASHQITVRTTQVPTSYSKPFSTILKLLIKDLTVARESARDQTGSYAADSVKVLHDAQALDSDAAALFHRVKTTPIIVLATQKFFDDHHIPVNVGNTISSAIGKARGQSTTVLNNAVSILTGTLNAIFDTLVVLIMSLYLLADGGRFVGWMIGLVPASHREQAWFFVGSLNRVLGGYIRGQLIVAITIGILAGVGCWVIGVPYALLLGIFAFLAESIPVMGPIIASVPAILVALFTLPVLQVVIVIAWFIVIQQIEQNVVGPRITGHAVGIHPIVAMVAVILGLEIGGIWGAFLAVPVAGILFVIVGEGYNYLILQRPLPTAHVPQSMETDGHGKEGGGSAVAN